MNYIKCNKKNKQTTAQRKLVKMSVIKATSLDLSQVTFSDVKSDIHGRKMVYINRNNGKIIVQTPKMYAPNGIKRWRKKDSVDNKDDKFEMELSFYGENNSEELRTFHEKWNEFDELIKTKVIEKSKEWLSMPKLDKSTLESVMYTPMVKVPKDKEGNDLPYPSRVRVKLDREMDYAGNYTSRFSSNKKFKTEVMIFNDKKEKMEMDENNAEIIVPKGSQVVCVMELVYLSLSKTTISTKWKLVQAKVFKNKESINGYAMLDDESSQQEDTNEQQQRQYQQEEREKREQQQEQSLQIEEVSNVRAIRKRVSKLNV